MDKMNTKSLDIFLRALEKALTFKKNYYIVHKITTSNLKFPVIKNIKISVYCTGKAYKECICTVEKQYNSSDIDESEILEELTVEVIENMLKFYGL